MSIVSMAQVVKAAQAANLSNPDLYSIQPGDLSPSKANWHVVKRVFNFISQYDDDEEDGKSFKRITSRVFIIKLFKIW